MGNMDIKKAKPTTRPAAQQVTKIAEAKRGGQLKRAKAKIIGGALALLLIFSIFVTYKYLQANRQIRQLRNNPQQVVSTSTNKLLAHVKQLAVLPSGNPTVAIVKDVSKLPHQPFFADAQNGDYVIVYTQAKRAILYRPSSNKIVAYENTN